MSKNEFTISLNVENIGPHFDSNKINFSHEVESNKAIFYAVNGTGKSFISRTFRLTELPDTTPNDLLTLEKNNGSLSFGIKNNESVKQLSIHLERGKVANINNDLGLIFHTFNSDYVEDNIKPNNYSPNGNIEGYILGKTQIDLSAEKAQEAKLVTELELLNKAIEKSINQAKNDLRSAGVVSNTNEMSLISRIELEKHKTFEDVLTYEQTLEQLEKLRTIPENIADISIPKFDIDTSYLSEIIDEFNTAYSKSAWDEEFVKYYKENREFIENGLDIISPNNTACPFCQRPFDEQALRLIKLYSDYRTDKEAQTIAKLDSYIKKLRSIIKAIENGNNQIGNAQAQLTKLKGYFPSLVDYNLDSVDIGGEHLKYFTDICELLNAKIDNLVLTFDNGKDKVKLLEKYLYTVQTIYKNNASIIEAINRTKNDTNQERLNLRRKLCKAKYLECGIALKDKFTQASILQSKLNELRNSIREKEEQVKVSKRDKVYSTLTSFLNLFFDGKYTIDKESFQIRFLGNTVGPNASRILSDGEKSIVAYCYYLSTTHLLVEREFDYDKLFFIIDDPISSMDFHYVYMVAQSLRDIKNTFGITSHERIWVFTHNMEFLSIITRNHILEKAFVITPGKIDKIDSRLLMPYESHLTDIVRIARREALPTHTTANSIRHVIETVCQFEYPELGIENYISSDEILSKNAYIYSICQDLSHGKLRNQPPYSADILISACDTIVEFMNSKYKGQIDAIK